MLKTKSKPNSHEPKSKEEKEKGIGQQKAMPQRKRAKKIIGRKSKKLAKSAHKADNRVGREEEGTQKGHLESLEEKGKNRIGL